MNAGRKANYRTDVNAASLKSTGGSRDESRIYADSGETVFASLGTEIYNVSRCGIRMQKRVIDS